MIKAIVGANWGDEGKGKLTDVFAGQSDIVIRFQGGANAGHTIINNYGRFALHQLPSGVFHENIVNIIGNGVALNVEGLMRELDSVVSQGVPTPKLMISERTQIVMPYHILFDEYEEERLGKGAFGSTKSGIAPFYSDKFSKIGIQICDLFDENVLRTKIERALEIKNVILVNLYHKSVLNADDIMAKMLEYRDMVAPYVADTFSFLQQAVREGKTILLEGQLGSLRDPDLGIYPMTTSSSTLAGYGTVGAGLPAREITEVVAVTKAYSSCVGAGAFVSEIFGDEAKELRDRGGDKGEYGATTGRPRRVGWFDCVATRYGCMAQGATTVALTCLDVLGYLEQIPVCVAYELDGERIDTFPVTSKLEKCKPVIEYLPGWNCSTRGIRNYDELPENARAYVEFIEKQLGFRVGIVSNGPDREDIIYR